MTVLWPWVFVWQISLALPVIWLIWQLWCKPLSQFALGHYLDWVVALAGFSIILSSLMASFPNQARWYGWAALCGIASLYALRGWMKTLQRSQQVLTLQGCLGIAFIVLSLGLWLAQILLPELERLQVIQSYGIDISFSFRSPSIRNWQPIGHPNYVAGYLLLIVPLLIGLGFQKKGWRRRLWWSGAALGLLNLYTTSSRGAWLGLMAALIFSIAVALFYSRLPRLWLGLIGLGSGGAVVLFALTNSRLRSLLFAPLSGEGGQLAYRIITNVAGWRMGLERPMVGLGLGSVPIAYQQYRPGWAGWEAEMVYQLHSTPAQLWAELGVLGILVPLMAIALGSFAILRWVNSDASTQGDAVLVWSLLTALVAYGVMSLTDYQLDNLCVIGTLLIFLVYLSQSLQPTGAREANIAHPRFPRLRRVIAIALATLTVIVHSWLFPIHRAWALSSEGFTQLRQQNIAGFVDKLTQAHQIVPWEPYYAYQLGWNLGDLSFQATAPEQQQQLRQEAIDWFQTANQISPYQEFGYSNLGWLALNQGDVDTAVNAFAKSAQLVPAKKGVFFGLGFSLMQQGKPDLAAQAIALELIRQPILITSPVWQVGALAAIADQVIQQTLAIYSQLEEKGAPSNSALSAYIHKNRGALYWWLGQSDQAAADWSISSTPLNKILLQFTQSANQFDGEALETQINALPQTGAKYALLAWLNPAERQTLLETAWTSYPLQDLTTLNEILPPADIINQIIQTMNTADSLQNWLTQNFLTWQPRSQRSGFGVLSRHIDGPLPTDYLPRIENLTATRLLPESFDMNVYLPLLDQTLQSQRFSLLNQVSI